MGLTSTPSTASGPTADWRPMAFGDRHHAMIRDPFYEPLWEGRRVIVDVSARGVAVRDVDLGGHAGAADLVAALTAAALADEALIDGYLLAGPLPGADDTPPVARGATDSITRGSMFRQMLVGGLGRRGRGQAAEPVEVRPAALPADGPIAFVAVDLLWLDGEALIDLPLGERKRLLEAVLAEGELVRRTPSVRAPVERWQGQWRNQGFRGVAVKAANSRYMPGGLSEDWTIVPIPHR